MHRCSNATCNPREPQFQATISGTCCALRCTVFIYNKLICPVDSYASPAACLTSAKPNCDGRTGSSAPASLSKRVVAMTNTVFSKVHRAHRIPVPKLQTRFRQRVLRYWDPARSAGSLHGWQPVLPLLPAAIQPLQRLHQCTSSCSSRPTLACLYTCHCAPVAAVV
jgi:hypothetical protein